jgi:TonB family protein
MKHLNEMKNIPQFLILTLQPLLLNQGLNAPIFRSVLQAVLVLIVIASTAIAEPPKQERAVALYAPYPNFSYEVRRAHPADGLFELHVRTDGTISEVGVLKSTGHKVADIEAAATFAKWRFKPGSAKSVRIPLSFKHG